MLFTELGVKIKNFFKWERNNSPSVKIVEKHTDKSRQIHYHSANIEETKALVMLIIESQLPQLEEKAKLVATERTNEFLQGIYKKLPELSEQERNGFSEPDVQMVMREASWLSARRTNPELRAVLANLVINRIKGGSVEEFKNLLYGEAVKTVGKLTLEQLNLLVLTEELNYVEYGGIFFWDQLRLQLDETITPFITEVVPKGADFQHLEYAGCASISVGSWNFLERVRGKYTTAVLKKFSLDEITDLELPDELKQKIFSKDGDFILKVQNLEQLKKAFKNPEDPLVKKIIESYEKHIPSSEEIRQKIETETAIGSKLLKFLDSSEIQHLSLTSVGTIIANTYLEEKTGQKIDMSKWYGNQ